MNYEIKDLDERLLDIEKRYNDAFDESFDIVNATLEKPLDKTIIYTMFLFCISDRLKYLRNYNNYRAITKKYQIKIRESKRSHNSSNLINGESGRHNSGRKKIMCEHNIHAKLCKTCRKSNGNLCTHNLIPFQCRECKPWTCETCGNKYSEGYKRRHLASKLHIKNSTPKKPVNLFSM